MHLHYKNTSYSLALSVISFLTKLWKCCRKQWITFPICVSNYSKVFVTADCWQHYGMLHVMKAVKSQFYGVSL